MVKTNFLAQVKGFTPVIDTLVEEIGLMPALVYGVVWRYCQMEDGICRASLEKIGSRIGISRKTVERHIKELCRAGYLKDMTPDLRNRPHIYANTGRAKIVGLVEAQVAQTESPTKTITQSESLSTQSESPTRSDRESDEDSIKREIKERIDPLVDIFTRAIQASGNGHKPRPRGWENVSDDEFAICQRVADLWKAGHLPHSSQQIERQAAGAHELLEMHGGDLRATLVTLDKYAETEDGKKLNIAGPQSLTNVIPIYLAKHAPRQIRIEV